MSAPKVTSAITALALVFGLGACGDDDSTTTGASTSSQTAAQGAASGSTGSSGSKGQSEEAQNGEQPKAPGGSTASGDSGSGKSGASGGDSASHSEFKPAPLRVSGGGSEQFVQKGGDNSIQEFGDEGDESELQQAAETVHGFLVARGQEEWALACSYMSDSMAEKLEKLLESSGSEDTNCAAALNAMTVPVSADLGRALTEVDAASLRHEGDEQAFLIYTGFQNEVYAMPMNQKDGVWKVSAIQGNQLTF